MGVAWSRPLQPVGVLVQGASGAGFRRDEAAVRVRAGADAAVGAEVAPLMVLEERAARPRLLMRSCECHVVQEAVSL